jgi:UDP-glucose 4-epimerase
MQSGQLKETLETKPNTPYGFAKDTLRRQLQDLQKVEPFNLTWARLFYLYGEGQSDASLLPQLKRAVENGEKNSTCREENNYVIIFQCPKLQNTFLTWQQKYKITVS